MRDRDSHRAAVVFLQILRSSRNFREDLLLFFDFFYFYAECCKIFEEGGIALRHRLASGDLAAEESQKHRLCHNYSVVAVSAQRLAR